MNSSNTKEQFFFYISCHLFSRHHKAKHIVEKEIHTYDLQQLISIILMYLVPSLTAAYAYINYENILICYQKI